MNHGNVLAGFLFWLDMERRIGLGDNFERMDKTQGNACSVGLRESYPGTARTSVLLVVPKGAYSVIRLESFLTEDGLKTFFHNKFQLLCFFLLVCWLFVFPVIST